MKIAQTIILVILILLTLAAGAAKAMKMPQEVQFFAYAGLGMTTMIALGVFQITGAVLSAVPKFRMIGTAMMGAGFLASAIIIMMTGDMTFALMSLIPVLLSGFVFVGRRNDN